MEKTIIQILYDIFFNPDTEKIIYLNISSIESNLIFLIADFNKYLTNKNIKHNTHYFNCTNCTDLSNIDFNKYTRFFIETRKNLDFTKFSINVININQYDYKSLKDFDYIYNEISQIIF